MKKWFLPLTLIFALTSTVWAIPFPYTGSITSGDGLFGTGPWSSNADLSWTVTPPNQPSDFWKYEYTFTVPSKGISHVIIEATSDDPTTQDNEAFTSSNIKDGTTLGRAINTYSSEDQGNSNPGMLSSLYGIKWDTPDTQNEILLFSWVLMTDRAPMWGDFYAKDGKENQGQVQVDVYAYNVKFGQDTNDLIGDGNAGGWVLVPDTNGGGGSEIPIPEPATMLLLGSGLIGLAGYARRKFRKLS